jgi:hypothetical protein
VEGRIKEWVSGESWDENVEFMDGYEADNW